MKRCRSRSDTQLSQKDHPARSDATTYLTPSSQQQKHKQLIQDHKQILRKQRRNKQRQFITQKPDLEFDEVKKKLEFSESDKSTSKHQVETIEYAQTNEQTQGPRFGEHTSKQPPSRPQFSQHAADKTYLYRDDWGIGYLFRNLKASPARDNPRLTQLPPPVIAQGNIDSKQCQAHQAPEQNQTGSDKKAQQQQQGQENHLSTLIGWSLWSYNCFRGTLSPADSNGGPKRSHSNVLDQPKPHKGWLHKMKSLMV